MQTARTSPKSIVGNLGVTAERKPANLYFISVEPFAPTGETWGSLVYLEVKTCLNASAGATIHP